MITSTTFKNVTIRAKIMGAMRRAKAFKEPQWVLNAAGCAFLQVERVDSVIRCFKFTSALGNDITETVYRGLKE